MKFEWDADKAQSNFEKHGVRFEIASGVFIDPDRITAVDDRFDYGEERLVTLGQTLDGILVVVTTERDEGRSMRLISARKANRRERNTYGDR
ncbi:MAG: BrnT family toxin [Paracoccaceae bacterium]|uniref:BrnT family toxin n=1 Tax=Rhodobacterales TaxID=204455 RepID=UPI0032983E76